MIKNYLITALRNILRYKVFSLINLVGLAAGLTVFILIFLWVKNELSYDSFVPKGEQIYRVNFEYDRNGATMEHWRTPPAMAKSLKDRLPEVVASTRFYTEAKMLASTSPENRFYILPGYTDSTFFQMFGIRFLKGDVRYAFQQTRSLVMTEKMATQLFGNEDPVGKPVKLDNRFDFTVTGVIGTPPGNSYLQYDCLIPFGRMEEMLGYGEEDSWNDWGYNTFLLLPEGVDTRASEKKMEAFMENNLAGTVRHLFLQPLLEIHLVGVNENGVARSIYIVSSIALFVLLIACINYMNLATARAMRRSREIAIRKVGGASRNQLIMQFLSESVILCFLALGIALVAVWLILPLFNNLADREISLQLSRGGLIVTLILITFLTGIIAGSYPAFLLSSVKPVSIMYNQGKQGRSVFRKVLVVFQFALSVFLVICTIVFSRQLQYLGDQKLGFETSHVVFIPLNEQLSSRFHAFRNELLSNPHIEGVSATSNKIGTRPFWGTVVNNWQGRTGEDSFTLNIIYADCDFQTTFGLPMAEGRFFSPEHPSDSGAVVINEAAARRMGMEEAVGKTILNDSAHIIGVMKDFNFRSLHEKIDPMMLILDPQYFTEVGIRIGSGHVETALVSIERAFVTYAPGYPYQYSFLDDEITGMYRDEARMQKLFLSFSVLAILITCLGLFGLAMFAAEQKIREIGIRKVMGASVVQIGYRFAREYAGLVLLANLIAWPLAWYAMHSWLEGFAYRTGIGWWIFLLAGLITFLVAILTMSSQTIRAALTNPAETLKYE